MSDSVDPDQMPWPIPSGPYVRQLTEWFCKQMAKTLSLCTDAHAVPWQILLYPIRIFFPGISQFSTKKGIIPCLLDALPFCIIYVAGAD